MPYKKLFFQKKIIILLALIITYTSPGAAASTKGCVADQCFNPAPEGWRLTYTESDDGNNGIINSIIRYEYSPKGEMIAMKEENLDSSSSKKYEYRHDFDGKGRLLRISADLELDGEFETTISYHYDRNGTLSKIRNHYGYDITQTLTYDDSCRIQELSFDDFKTQFSYDDIGRRISERTFTLRQTKDNAEMPSSGTDDSDASEPALQLMLDYSYEYDELGNIILMEGPLMNTYNVNQFEYDKIGRLSKKIFTSTRGREPGGDVFMEDTTYYYWEESGDITSQMKQTHPCL